MFDEATQASQTFYCEAKALLGSMWCALTALRPRYHHNHSSSALTSSNLCPNTAATDPHPTRSHVPNPTARDVAISVHCDLGTFARSVRRLCALHSCTSCTKTPLADEWLMRR